MALSAEDVAHFREFGYVVVRAAYQPSRIAELRAAAERFLARDPAGVAWVTPEGAQRVLGGQKLNHLLLPDKFEPVYAEWLAEDALPHLEALIEGGQVRHSLFNMFVCGDLASVGEDWEQLSHGRTVQLWHRDVHPNQSSLHDVEPEWLRLRHALHGRVVQMNAPLLPTDNILQIVPGSHTRESTAEEVAAAIASRSDPHGVEMPGAVTVKLEAGDAAYYDFTIWHRGHNPEGAARMTIHNAYWDASMPMCAHEGYADQADGLAETLRAHRLPERARAMVERYLQAGRAAPESPPWVDAALLPEHLTNSPGWLAEHGGQAAKL